MRILLVEDSQTLSEAIVECLKRASLEADVSASGGDALALLDNHQYGMMILDLGLPDMDGMDLLKQMRANNNPLPVLVLTARNALSSKVAGLESGADDYMVKPFQPEELVARIRALLRRPYQVAGFLLRLSNVSLDINNGQAMVGEKLLALSRRETDLLGQFLRTPDKIVAKKAIETRIYGQDNKGSENAIEVLVHRLRKKLIDHAAEVEIKTLKGIGYMITSTCDAEAV